MKIITKKALILAIAALLITGGIIGAVYAIRANQYVFKLTLSETSCVLASLYPTYYFVLDKNNVLYCSMGSRQDDMLENKYLVNAERISKKQLSKEEVKVILDIANYIGENGEKPTIKRSGYTSVEFFYQGTDYFNAYPNGKLGELVNELKKFKPIPIRII